MEELITSFHIHTLFSDGSLSHNEIAKIAIQEGVDVLVFTDHNILVKGLDGYYHHGNEKVLILCGEELHNRNLLPPKNHLLVIGHNRELSQYAHDLEMLTRQITFEKGLSFIAHPFEDTLPSYRQASFGWDEWEVDGIHGLEIWNQLSELKTSARNKIEAIFLSFFPGRIANGPHPKTLQKWDELLIKGKRLVAIGGADAHGLIKRIGPFKKLIFPYNFHFRGITNHLLVERPLSEDDSADRAMILEAFRKGHCFIAYDLPYPTRDFRFSAVNMDQEVIMGDRIELLGGVTLKINLPIKTEVQLIKDGKVIGQYFTKIISKPISDPGIYRVEAFINYLGKRRGWIYSNPINVQKKPSK